MSTENWRDIPGFEGRYQVSDLGRVRSVDRVTRTVAKNGREAQRLARGRVLQPGCCRGYLIVNLSVEGKAKTTAVHLLVARAHLAPQPDGREVNHIDGDKRNNRAANLEWVTRGENLRHAVALGLNRQAVAVVNPETGERYASLNQAARAARRRLQHVRGWAAT